MFSAIQPGYYMNKNHWNTVTLDGSVPQELLLTMIEASYRLVVKGLRKAERELLG
jgi:predicted DNA-binding protein (MmcQ/YjbR family)